MLLALSIQLFSQDTLSTDTTYLSLEQVLKMTLSFHPVVSQANLLSQDAESRLTMARGQMDPKLVVRLRT